MIPLTSHTFGLQWHSPGLRFVAASDQWMGRKYLRCEMEAECRVDVKTIAKTELWADMTALHNIATPVGQIAPGVRWRGFRWKTESGLSFDMPMYVNRWGSGLSSRDNTFSVLLKNGHDTPTEFHWPSHHLWNPDLTAMMARHQEHHDIAHVIADWLEEHGEDAFAQTAVAVDAKLLVETVWKYREAVCRRKIGWPGWENYLVEWYQERTRIPDEDEENDYENW